jgi:hypothetical protein
MCNCASTPIKLFYTLLNEKKYRKRKGQYAKWQISRARAAQRKNTPKSLLRATPHHFDLPLRSPPFSSPLTMADREFRSPHFSEVRIIIPSPLSSSLGFHYFCTLAPLRIKRKKSSSRTPQTAALSCA